MRTSTKIMTLLLLLLVLFSVAHASDTNINTHNGVEVELKDLGLQVNYYVDTDINDGTSTEFDFNQHVTKHIDLNMSDELDNKGHTDTTIGLIYHMSI